MKIELNLWLQPNHSYRAQLNINRGETKLNLGRLKDFETFCLEGLESSRINSEWINAFLETNPDSQAYYAWTNVVTNQDYISYNLRHAYTIATIDSKSTLLPMNKVYRQIHQYSPTASFRN